MPETSIAALAARIACSHRTIAERPCGRCGGWAIRKVKEFGEPLVEKTARTLMRMDGFTDPPTPLVYLAAVRLLDELVPAIRGQSA